MRKQLSKTAHTSPANKGMVAIGIMTLGGLLALPIVLTVRSDGLSLLDSLPAIDIYQRQGPDPLADLKRELKVGA